MPIISKHAVILIFIGVVVAMLSLAHPAAAASLDSDRCKALARADFSGVRDAPFTVTSAAIVSDANAPLFCRVEAYVLPRITFELKMPINGWNRGFMLVGSGGWATERFVFLCKEPLRRGYACIAGDAGYQTGRGLWMSDPRASVDWGYRATHVTALAGKTLVQSFYGVLPKLSLMIGTSTGGYQALVEAQRFPWDFAGIVAVAPDINEAGLAMRTEWERRNLIGVDGRSLFSARDLAVLHRGAVDACDRSDGVRDGIIGDPLACHFDPVGLACRGDGSDGCLNPIQVEAARRIYAGPATSSGEKLSAGGLLPGSELGWAEIPEDTFPDEFFKAAFTEPPGGGIPAARFDFDRDFKRLGLAGTVVDDNPDLRLFRQAGGKLLIVQGANDTVEQPPVLVDYYEAVERAMGGRAVAHGFVRLFIVPGMNHATGGDGAFAIDYLSAIERWATAGRPPDVLVAAHVPAWAKGLTGMVAGLTAPSSDQPVTFTRPVYPYPLHARYRGHGPVGNWHSFQAAGSR